MTHTPHTKTVSGLVLFCGLMMTCLSQSGCAKSPDELLIGRWYTDNMTFRFREDNAVIWNSTEGLALGRFEFSGKVRKSHRDTKEPNLLIDVIRNDERQRFQFEIGFLGHDRLKMHLIPLNAPVNANPNATGLVLRRAVDDETLGGGPAKVAQR